MPKVLLKFFEEAVERTEEEIAELRAGGLLREQGPVPGVRGSAPAAPAPEPPQTDPPQGGTPPGGPPPNAPQGDKSKEQK